ncbi:MAG TPA: M56 family metallopeptidase [Rhizomicrobium sp.]|nr:M56 family metallopeptidase [Rhizomicrobium sp.]
MTDCLFLLAKTNLAMVGAILVVSLLRRPMRNAFHARISYGLWLLVPAAMLASLLPPRVIVIAADPVSGPIPLALPAAPVRAAAQFVQAAPLDWSLLLFIVWLVGMGAMALVMARQQRHFHAAERLGGAGPAVTGFLRPRIVIPLDFAAQFSAGEQAAVLAHEAAHLARQDARINAMVAGLRCLCWFNPLVHLGALWLRKDQELACDASAVAKVGRSDYANALLKSQMRAMALPLGCAWPRSEHPLTERVALLKHRAPRAARRRTGMAAIALLTLCGGVGAWAAQPVGTVAGPANREASNGKSVCENRSGFCGKYFYAERAGDGGPASFMTLESDQVDKFNGGQQRAQVVMHFPYGMALADTAHNDFHTDQNLADHKTISLSGNVRLITTVTGIDALHGQTLVFDARTGMLDLDGRVLPSGMPKYVPCTKDCKHF